LTPGKLSERVISERSEWIREMVVRVRDLPLGSIGEFTADSRNVDAAESCLRRGLEALLDLGRHVLAKGFGDAPAEYKEVAERLGERGVLTPDTTRLFVQMAGYRNRMVHFYDRVSDGELFEIASRRLGDIEEILAGLHGWIHEHPEAVESRL
jgi:uncharacterized protein YutE (UPF0331/DUF86 family)